MLVIYKKKLTKLEEARQCKTMRCQREVELKALEISRRLELPKDWNVCLECLKQMGLENE